MNKIIEGTVVQVKTFSNELFSIFLKAKISKFIPGQYNRIIFFNEKKEKIQRAYSYVNAPKEKIIEFYIALIHQGIITPKLIQLKTQKKIFIYQHSFGDFTLKNIPSCDNLWLFATGTAIGPYLSILKEQNSDINRFKKIILIHAVRYYNDLNHLNTIMYLKNKYKTKLYYLTIISREKTNNSLHGRIPLLLKENKIEETVKCNINKNNTHIMLCGNPGMVKETKKILREKYNLTMHLQRKSGQITVENYW
ncbi:Flavodoxin/ferredoxin--NADP reductase [Buchnera aphidicola (Thelaxes suberi)]|uniref:ferredoxin--NADP reductase n=1 Tax=Buchnera aphidicola TaxID=9 RepID=UPI0034640877